MISILNGYDFKRNFENVIVFPISQLAGCLDIQPYVLKEHYYHCVSDDCAAQGEFHSEEIVRGEIELYLPSYNVKYLVDSLHREGFEFNEFQATSIMERMLETQRIVSECFDLKTGTPSYSDPIRKNDIQFVKPISESISKKN